MLRLPRRRKGSRFDWRLLVAVVGAAAISLALIIALFVLLDLLAVLAGRWE